MLTNYDVTAIIATCALLLSLAFWITLKKRWLPQLKTDIIAEAPAIGRKTYDLIKEDLPDIKELFKKELPEVITAFKKEFPDFENLITRFKKELKDELPDLKTEIPKLIAAEAPKLIETFLEDITKRINDPKEEKLADVMSAMAFSGMAAFRACMQDPDFKKDVDNFMNGKMSLLGTYLEKRMPEIIAKAAPDIKKVILGGGGGGEASGGLLGMLGINLKDLGVGIGL